MNINGELVKIRKEAIVVYFSIPFPETEKKA
jgi:hypothetical protein